MAAVGLPIWAAGVWADTVWAAGVWRDETFVPPVEYVAVFGVFTVEPRIGATTFTMNEDG